MSNKQLIPIDTDRIRRHLKMNSTVVNVINCAFAWSIVALAICGYLLTLKRIGEKWPFWIVLAIGWSFLAVFETLLTSGMSIGNLQITTAWLTSYLLVMASLLLLFLKFIQIKATE
jgi:hypothetical protein